MSEILAFPALSATVYFDERVLEKERKMFFFQQWQWIGTRSQLDTEGTIKTNIAGLPLLIKNSAEGLGCYIVNGRSFAPLPDNQTDYCGDFLFLRLSSRGPSLKDYLGHYYDLLIYCSENFHEAFHVKTVEWKCNWKIGIEASLEGYHVPIIHIGGKNSLSNALPEGVPSDFYGSHSQQSGLMSDQMRAEMANIARRLKIKQSAECMDYHHYSLFPNMGVGMSGGCICFLQIYTPLTATTTQLHYMYFLARPLDKDTKPAQPIKKALLDAWREYTEMIMMEDRVACEYMQKGVHWAYTQGVLGRAIEERVIHFQKHWRETIQPEGTEAIWLRA